MVKAKCQLQECEFRVEDGEHIDDVVTQMREHWRAQHPTKYFSAHNCAKAAQSYNMTWEEVMNNHYGHGWEQAGVDIANDRYTLTDIANSRNYSEEVKAQAAQMLEARQQRQEVQAAPAPPGGRRFRPGRGIRGMAQAGENQEAVPVPPENAEAVPMMPMPAPIQWDAVDIQNAAGGVLRFEPDFPEIAGDEMEGDDVEF